MKRITMILAVATLGALIASSIASAAVPSNINYQGRLRDGSGNNVSDGVYTLAFKIYDAPSGGSLLWSETLPVQVTVGLFTVELGNSIPIPANLFSTGTNRYLGVTVNSDPEMLPRTHLNSVAYTYQAKDADMATLAQDLTCTGCVSGSEVDATQVQLRVTGTAPGGQYITGINQNGTVVTAPDANNAYTAATGLVLNGTQFAIAPNGVTSTEIANGTISFSDIGQNGAGANQVMKWNGAVWSASNDDAGTPSGWADDGATVRLLTDADKVGIGTAAPTKKLDVAGSIKVGINDTIFSSYLSSNSPLRLQTAGTTRLFIDDAAGNVGIGTGNPSLAKLQVGGDIYTTAGLGFYPTGGSGANNVIYRGGTDFFILRNYNQPYTVAQVWSPPGALGSSTAQEATLALVRGNEPNQEYLDFYNNGYSSETQFGIRLQKRGTGQYRDFVIDQSDGVTKTPLLSVKASGKVGVGVTNPQNKLDIEGSAVIGSSYSGINTAPTDGLLVEGDVGIGLANPEPGTRLDVRGQILASGVSGGGYRAFVANGSVGGVTKFGATSGGGESRGALAIQTNDADRMYIDVNGNVGIGTTNTSTGRLAVDGGDLVVRRTDLAFQPSLTISPGYSLSYVLLSASSTAGGTFDGIVIQPGSGIVGIGARNPSYKLNVSGDVCAFNYFNCSDARLKKNIVPLTDVLKKLDNIRGVKFEWNENDDSLIQTAPGAHIGIVAQEMEKEFPELVLKDDKGYGAVDYSKLSAVLLEGIKEQQKEIEELKDRIEKLEKKNHQTKLDE